MHLILHDISDLPAAAEKLIAHVGDKRVIAFRGPMGAGKTTLIKALCDAMRVTDKVSSPTFSIVNEYRSGNGEKVYHFDFYRIKDVSEAFDMGCEEYFYSGAWCFIEWPEKVAEALPDSTQFVSMEVSGPDRFLTF